MEFAMDISKRKIDDTKWRVKVTLPAQQVTDLIDIFAQQYASALGITVTEGGWAHDEIITTVGIDATRKMFDEAIMSETAEVAITMLGLDIIASPQYFNETSAREGQPFTYEMTVFNKPQFTLSSYDPVEVYVPEFQVTDEDIQRLIEQETRAHSSLENDPSRKIVKPGDEVEMSISTMQHGEVVEDLTKDDYHYSLAGHFLPSEFESAIIGMAVGDTKIIDFMLPSSYGKDGRELPAVLVSSTVTIKGIQRTVIPTLTDEWVAENVDGYMNVADFTEHLRQEAVAQKAEDHRQQVANACAHELAERLEGKVSDEIFQACIDDLKKSFSREAKQRGYTIDEYRETMGLNPQQFNMAMMFQVQEQLNQTFALEALARHLGLEVEEEDYDILYSSIAPRHEALAQAQFERNGRTFVVQEAALHAKANNYLMEHAIFLSEPKE